MRYAIITYGSRGDVQPYIALALGLMDRGHDVALAANENFRPFAESYRVDLCPLHGDLEAMVTSPGVLRLLNTGNMISFLRHLNKIGRKMQPLINEDMMKACKNFDVLIASPLTFTWVYSIAEKLGKKWAVVNLSLPTQPTKEFPFAGFAFFDAPWYNLFTYRLLRYIYWQLNKKEVREHRAALGLPPLKKSILKKISEQNILSLYSFSPSLIHRPRDWDDNIDITGFLTMPNKDTEEPDPELIAWLTNGEPPIYFGFGSIPIPDSKLFANILNELLASTDHRFIFCQGWSQLPDLPHNERLFIIKQINHGWLFPQCKIAVIHGGIGTVAAALKARIPVIIVSIFADQPLWGKIIAGKNLGVHIPFKKLTTEKLSDAIRKTQAPEMIKSVAEIGEKINNEGGLGSTINKIEDYFR